MKLLYVLSLSVWVLSSCQNNGSVEKSGDFAGYTLEKIPGSSFQRAYKTEAGRLIEEGTVLKGQKNGEWVTYHNDEKNYPKVIANYTGGVLNGAYMEISQFGQFTLVAHYRNDQLDGRVARYNFTRLSEEVYYKNGVKDGPYAVYFENSDIKQRTGQFRNGVEDGLIRFYNDKGKVTVEYVYKDGQKVSGGMVEPEGKTEE